MNKSKILVVDDSSVNRNVIRHILQKEYELSLVSSGMEALLQIKSGFCPDLILLDIILPEMDGYEICKRLKLDPKTAGIPIIFITALDTPDEEKKGLQYGAIDFITKPFNSNLVKARVVNHLKLKKYQDQLEQLVESKTMELQEAHRRLLIIDETRSKFLQAIAHELSTPANGIFGAATLAIECIPDDETKAKVSKLFNSSRKRMQSTIALSLKLGKLQSAKTSIDMAPFSFCDCIKEAIDIVKQKHPDSVIEYPNSSMNTLQIQGNRDLLNEAIETLLTVCLNLDENKSSLVTEISTDQDQLFFKIKSPLINMEEGMLHSFFDEFSYERSSSKLQQFGLAIPIAKKIIELMAGSVKIQSGADSGFQLVLTFSKSKT